jgi:cytochrome c oxidase subunit 4
MEHKFEHLEQRHQDAKPPPSKTRPYYWIWLWLMILLGLTVGMSFVPLDRIFPGFSATIAFLIAAAKASLVVLFFMHVKQASKMTWVFCSAGMLWLAIMFSLTFSDYLSRAQLPGSLTAAPDEQWPFPLEHVNRWVEDPVSNRVIWAEPAGRELPNSLPATRPAEP